MQYHTMSKRPRQFIDKVIDTGVVDEEAEGIEEIRKIFSKAHFYFNPETGDLFGSYTLIEEEDVELKHVSQKDFIGECYRFAVKVKLTAGNIDF